MEASRPWCTSWRRSSWLRARRGAAPGAQGETLLHQALVQLEGEELARDAAVEVLVHDSRVVHPDLQVAVTEVVLELDRELAGDVFLRRRGLGRNRRSRRRW